MYEILKARGQSSLSLLLTNKIDSLYCPLENDYSILMKSLYSIVHERPQVCCFSRNLHPFSLVLSSRSFNDREAGRQRDTGRCFLGYLETWLELGATAASPLHRHAGDKLYSRVA